MADDCFLEWGKAAPDWTNHSEIGDRIANRWHAERKREMRRMEEEE